MRVYKPRPTSKTWRVEYRDVNGRPRRVGGFGDKKASQELGRRLDRLVAAQAAGQSLDTDMVRWLETVPGRLRERLGELGLLEARTVAASKPLADHIDDWHNVLTAKGNTWKHARTVKARAKAVFEGCGANYWSDIQAARAQGFLGELRESGKSIRTCNFYLQAARQFCRWMVRERRAWQNPLAHLQGDNPRKDPKRVRRAVSADEFRHLLKTTKGGPIRQGLAGTERAMLYRLASETGLRANELRSLTRGSFDLDGDEPTVTVAAAYSKHRRDDVLPLRADTTAELKAHLESKLPDARAFIVPERTAEILRADLVAARKEWVKAARTCEERQKRRKTDFLRYRDRSGRVFDFHALRGQFASNLAAGGVHPKVAQELLRHSTIGLTMDIYTHTPRGSLGAALDVLPDLSGLDAESAKATGTDDATADSSVGNGGAPVGATEPKTVQFGSTECAQGGNNGEGHSTADSSKDRGMQGQTAVLSDEEGDNGEGGIRTPGTGITQPNGLANRRIQPLCHLSLPSCLVLARL